MRTAPGLTRWRRGLALGVAGLAVGVGLAAPASADSRPTDPTDPATPTTVTNDALPTVQISGGTVNPRPGGVVWSQAVVGNTVYVGGDFTKARPAGSAAGQNEVTRTYLLAYDITTGQLISSFNHTLNGQIRSVVASPDGKRVYVAGDFTQVDGQWRVFIAAFSTADGSLVAGFRPSLSSAGLSLAATNSTVYAGGNFTRAASVTGGTLVPRGYLAAFDATDGALLPFQADANAPVTALAVSADGGRLAVGGRFSTLSGAKAPGLGSVHPTSGALQSFPVNSIIKTYNGQTATISQLVADGDSIFGAAQTHNVANGTSEGVFRIDASTGAMVWNADCHGDTYAVFPMGGAVYQAGHAHDCARIGGFDNVGFYRGIAFSRAVTGTVRSIPADAPYTDHGGEPAPSLLTWFPDFPMGTYTGTNQGSWSVVGNGTYLSYGGEFAQVNGQAQQGLVRFGTAAVAPNKSGPRLSGTTWGTPDVTSSGGTVTATIGTNHDHDNGDLTYRLYRASSASPVAQSVQTSLWYRPGTVTLTEARAPVGMQTYWLTASDPFGNTVTSPKVQVEVVAPVPGQVASDSFGRSVSGGWGQAGTGGAWQPESVASMFSVDGGRGVLTVDRTSWTARARLSQVSVSDVDVSATMGIARRPATGWTRLVVSARVSQDFASGYLLRANVTPEGKVDSVQLMKGRDTLIAAAWPNPLVTLGPDDQLNMRLRVVGSTLQGKVWKAGTPEPTVWALQATDATVTGPGSVGAGVLTDTTSAPLPVVVTVDDFTATVVG